MEFVFLFYPFIGGRMGGKSSKKISMSKFAHILKVHPCYNEKLHDKVGRVHLPVAPKCNIACKFCRRSIDKECCEERPGVAKRIMKPEDVEDYLQELTKKMSNLKVVGIAGPGDSLFNKETFETLEIIGEKFPDLIKCISTNGLLLPKYAKKLSDLEVKTVTVTVNAIDPKILKNIVEWIYYDGEIYRGEEGASILIKNQMDGIKKAHDLGLIVKINTVLIPEINMDHIVDIARTFKDIAYLQNIIPLIPLYKMENLRPPTCEEIKSIREKCERYLPQFRACQQCRSDAVGLISEKRLNIFNLKHFSH